MGRIELLHVEPADGLVPGAAAEPQDAVLVELKMMRAEAEIDGGELLGLGIIQLRLAARPSQREHHRGWMLRTFLAEGRVCRRANARRHPEPSLLVKHRIVDAGVAVPDRLGAPI